MARVYVQCAPNQSFTPATALSILLGAQQAVAIIEGKVHAPVEIELYAQPRRPTCADLRLRAELKVLDPSDESRKKKLAERSFYLKSSETQYVTQRIVACHAEHGGPISD